MEQRQRLPKAEYTGQTTSELLALKDTHGVVSLIFAFELGIQNKARQMGESNLTEEERAFLAVQALDREVNNGGFHQFFWNSSRKYTPIVVDSLKRVGLKEFAEITARAIATLKPKELTIPAVEEAILKDDEERNRIFDAYSDEYYKFPQPYPALLQFIEQNQDQIQLVKTDDYPRLPKLREISNASKLRSRLSLHAVRNNQWDPPLEEAREKAKELAHSGKPPIPCNEADAEAAAVLVLFDRAVKKGDLEKGREFAPRAFELMSDDPTHILSQRNWTQLLIDSFLPIEADQTSLSYLKHLRSFDPSSARTKNYTNYWVELIQNNKDALPQSIAYLVSNFPEIDLDKPIPTRVIVIGRTAPGTGPKRPDSQ